LILAIVDAVSLHNRGWVVVGIKECPTAHFKPLHDVPSLQDAGYFVSTVKKRPEYLN
jgi:hypothetical protein